jgi:hypothetical protein
MVFVSGGLLAAQPFSLGVKGGVPVNGDIGTDYATSESKRYTVGPMATVALPAGLRLEADALYRRVGYLFTSIDVIGDQYFARYVGNSWEFPILLRRTLWRGVYAGAGYAPRAIHGSGHANGIYYEPLGRVYSETDLPGNWDTTHGVVGCAGVEKRAGPLRIAPEVRYTYWNKPSVDISGSRGSFVQTSQHQVEMLVGLSFP